LSKLGRNATNLGLVSNLNNEKSKNIKTIRTDQLSPVIELKMHAVQSVCKQRLCLHFGMQNIEFYSTTIYIFMILEYNKLLRDNNQALQEHKMK
jgi:hypothetical protein